MPRAFLSYFEGRSICAILAICKRSAKRDVFLAEMAATVPWSVLEAVIVPHYPQPGPQGGHRAFPIAVMLHIYCLQLVQSYDPGAEEALSESSRCARSAIWN